MNPGNPRNPRIRWMSSRIADLRVNNDDDDDDDDYYDVDIDADYAKYDGDAD